MNAPNDRQPENTRWLLFIFVIAFLFRVALAFIRHNPWMGGDSHAYVAMGEWFAKMGTDNRLGHPPIYPLFLTFVYVLPHYSFACALVMQAVVGALCSVLIYRLSVRWTSSYTALVAAAIVALDPFQIYFSTFFLSETLFTFLMLCGFLHLFKLEQSPTALRAGISGFFFALASLCRSILSPFLPLLMLSIFLLRRNKSSASPAGGILMLTFAFGVVFPLTAWSGYLHNRMGTWELVSSQRGWNCYEGLNPDFDQPEAVHLWQLSMYAECERYGLDSDAKRDQYFWAKTLQTMKAHPLRSANLMRRKFFKFWRLWPYFPYALRERIISAIFMTFLVSLALIGFSTLFRDLPTFRGPAVILSIFILLYSLANTFTWTEIRYRVPIQPLLAIFTAIGLFRLIYPRKAGIS